MKVVEIRREAELEGLKSAWRALLRDSSSQTIFLTWDWVAAWWASYGEPGDLRVLAAFDEQGVLRGIAPLRSRTVRRYSRTARALCFIGDGSNDSEYLDFILAKGYEKQCMESFRGYLGEQMSQGVILLLNEIPETSGNLVLLKSFAEEQGALWTDAELPCGTVHLPGSWEDYLNTLRPRFRTKIRSVLRNLENRPEIRFGFCETPEQVEQLLPVLFRLHTRRWAEDAKPGVFGWGRKRDFYSALSSRLLERGWLRFSWLNWKGQVLACQYGFTYAETYFHLQEGYEPDCEHWNLGVGLRAWSIREFLKQGLREYDFLGGMGRHKSDWGAETKRSKHVQLAAATYKNVLFCRGPEWEEGVRELARRIVPESVLSARRTRLEEKKRAIFQENHNGNSAALPDKQWIRKAAAYCYLYSGLPELARPLRERYQLSISPNGRRNLAWHRRTEPSARILYYHRINDENDPFFPATPTDVFDQQMRFIARHYQVVNLTKLLGHLEAGSPEPVIAITFDDGYADNHQNALPVLERYGLPATIFLTTGSLDANEPLWFERLAEALKRTGREFLDLEIDIPRRFWLRTEAERLRSNNVIFGLLRCLSDPERKRWLDQIMRHAEIAPEPLRKGRMLSWDQVRRMSTRGVDFGGHTVTHPFLSKTTREQAAWEINECKRRIEEEVQQSVSYFAYPNGREEDFGEWNKELIRRAGYRAALTTMWGLNYRNTDPLELKRGQPWEENAVIFAGKLDWYQLVSA